MPLQRGAWPGAESPSPPPIVELVRVRYNKTMKSLRARFVLSHILPLLVVIPLVGVALLYLFETQVLLAGLSQELERQATLVAAVAAENPLIWFDLDRAQVFVAVMGERLTAEVALFSPSGVLLASTDRADQIWLGQQLEISGLAEVLLTGQVVRVDYGERPGTGAAEVLMPVIIRRQIVGVIRLTDPLASVYERFPRTRTLIGAVVVAGLIVGVAMGFILALSLERPLKHATSAIGRMSSGEPLSTLPEQGPREIRLLLRAFNALTERLQSLEQARRRLLANLVHELGRPLGALLSASQALGAGADEEPELRRELVHGIEAEVKQMRHLLDDLTNLYDRSLGPLELDLRPVALSEWLPQVVAPWREAAAAKGLGWQADFPPGLPTLEFDPDRMSQALGNILSNAVKFTPPYGEIRVEAGAGDGAGRSGRGGWIRVSDTGPGVAPEEQARVFTPFYRGSVGRRFPQGMGLGLSIAADVVAAHSGDIELSSAPGKGTVVILWLPGGGGSQ